MAKKLRGRPKSEHDKVTLFSNARSLYFSKKLETKERDRKKLNGIEVSWPTEWVKEFTCTWPKTEKKDRDTQRILMGGDGIWCKHIWRLTFIRLKFNVFNQILWFYDTSVVAFRVSPYRVNAFEINVNEGKNEEKTENVKYNKQQVNSHTSEFLFE